MEDDTRMLPDINNPRRDRIGGLKRVRMIASVIGAVMFAFTGAQQFNAEGPQYIVPGTILSALFGFIIIFVVMTLVIVLFRVFKRGE
jgi:hypothetical protein